MEAASALGCSSYRLIPSAAAATHSAAAAPAAQYCCFALAAAAPARGLQWTGKSAAAATPFAKSLDWTPARSHAPSSPAIADAGAARVLSSCCPR